MQHGGPPLVGFWGLNGRINPAGLRDVRSRLGADLFHSATVDPAFATAVLLPMAREAGLKVSLRLTGDHGRYTRVNGDFDRGAWLAMLDRWDRDDVRAFVADGTLVGHMLLDDIYTFEGRPPDAEDLDALAAASHRILPGLMTFVREKATGLPAPRGGRYRHVDAVVNQYRVRDGDVQTYARDQAARSRALGLGIIMGLNIANGGDGSSGQPGWQQGRWAMSAAEIDRYGAVLTAVPGCSMFLSWEYDARERWSDGSVGADWFDQPAQTQALKQLSERMHQHPPVALGRPAAPTP